MFYRKEFPFKLKSHSLLLRSHSRPENPFHLGNLKRKPFPFGLFPYNNIRVYGVHSVVSFRRRRPYKLIEIGFHWKKFQMIFAYATRRLETSVVLADSKRN